MGCGTACRMSFRRWTFRSNKHYSKQTIEQSVNSQNYAIIATKTNSVKCPFDEMYNSANCTRSHRLIAAGYSESHSLYTVCTSMGVWSTRSLGKIIVAVDAPRSAEITFRLKFVAQDAGCQCSTGNFPTKTPENAFNVGRRFDYYGRGILVLHAAKPSPFYYCKVWSREWENRNENASPS